MSHSPILTCIWNQLPLSIQLHVYLLGLLRWFLLRYLTHMVCYVVNFGSVSVLTASWVDFSVSLNDVAPAVVAHLSLAHPEATCLQLQDYIKQYLPRFGFIEVEYTFVENYISPFVYCPCHLIKQPIPLGVLAIANKL